MDASINLNKKMKKDFLSTFSIPIAIVIAGVLVASSVILTQNSRQPAGVGQAGNDDPAEKSADLSVVRPIGTKEFVYGNRDAEIKVVEYADFNCSFCNLFHQTMKDIVADFETKGGVTWVVRWWPILGQTSPLLAEAAECVGEIGGEEAYWDYTDKIYEAIHDQRNFSEEKIEELAIEVGANASDLQACLESGRHQGKINLDAEEAQLSGGRGTPHSVIINEETGERRAVPGAQPYEEVARLINGLLE